MTNPHTAQQRIQKFMSAAGVCSRRTAEEWIQQGRVRINGVVHREMGTKIDPTRDRIEVDGKTITAPTNMIYLLMHKPPCVITSLSDPQGREIITDLLPENMPRVWPVGRLDYNSEGLILLTNDGNLTHLLTHPSHHVDKHYAIKVQGLLDKKSELLEHIRHGVELEDGEVTQPAFVRITGYTERNTWLEIIIAEGKNRQIRRMFEALDRLVMKLRRIRIGPLSIEGITAGAFRSLNSQEVYELYKALDAEMPAAAKPSKRQIKREQHTKTERTRMVRPQTRHTRRKRDSRDLPETDSRGRSSKSGTSKSGTSKSRSSKSGASKSGASKSGASKWW